MSWGCYSIRECMSCKNKYKVEESTLTINSSGYNKCPVCGEEGLLLTLSNEEKILQASEILKKNMANGEEIKVFCLS